MKSETAKRKEAVRTGDIGEGPSDVFTLMVKANEEEGSKLRLEDQELVSLKTVWPPIGWYLYTTITRLGMCFL